MNRSRVAGVDDDGDDGDDGGDGKRVVEIESNGGRKTVAKTKVHNRISVSNI